MREARPCLIFLFCFCCVAMAKAQDTTSQLDKLLAAPDKLFAVLDQKSKAIEAGLDRQTAKYLSKLQKQEQRLKKKLLKKDSTLAKELFQDLKAQYQQLQQLPSGLSQYSQVYSGRLDSLSTALNFLNGSQFSSVADHPQLEKTLSHYQSLQGKLNQTEQVKNYLQARQQLLKDQFQKLGMVRELKQFQKEVYYYQAQVREYQALWEDPSKLEAKLMEVVTRLPQFKDFFARNSQLGQLFALPGSGGAASVSLQGLQTRASVEQLMQERFGTGPQVMQTLQQNMQSAQGELSAIKDKVSQYSSGEYSNGAVGELPDFKPNGQKTRSFLKRLEYGGNLQSQRARNYFPVTSDLGFSLGYKLNDKSVIGVGAAYKLGWGSGFNNIKITHQGVGLRSYVDWKVKGALFISGGYELNYRSLIHSLDQLKDYSAWQRSGLVGVSKEYKVSKQVKGQMQLLWDFLSYQQVPRTQAVLFRIGYTLK